MSGLAIRVSLIALFLVITFCTDCDCGGIPNPDSSIQDHANPKKCHPGQIILCKLSGKIKCYTKSSANSCIDLTAKYKSGRARGEDSCVLYSKQNCQGKEITVDKKGVSDFQYIPKSYRCECSEKIQWMHIWILLIYSRIK